MGRVAKQERLEEKETQNCLSGRPVHPQEGPSVLRRAVCPQEEPSVLRRGRLSSGGAVCWLRVWRRQEAHLVFALLDHRGPCFSASPMKHRMGLQGLCSFKYEAKFCFVVFPNFRTDEGEID